MSAALGLGVVLLLCWGLAFLFAGMEAGALALSPLRIRQRARAGHPSARTLQWLLDHPEPFLWTILVGNTLASSVVVGLLVYVFYGWLGARPALLLPALALGVFLFYALGDLLPKMLFRQYPNRLCLRVARPFRLIHVALSPAVSLVAGFSALLLRWSGGRRFTGRLFGNRDELRLVMQESEHALSSEERRMVNRVLDLQVVTVGRITVPAAQVVSVAATAPIAEVFRLCRSTGLTRLPVRESPGGRSIGLVSLRTSLYRAQPEPSATAKDYLQPALFLDESLRLEVALQRMQRAGQRLAIVLDRRQREVGIVTLEDILRFVFGEVRL
ncbi:MAG: DUF21 domain-containing protein [Verrucomicrobia bacterium]|nr:DUF21 domain-containing protein [Verrucomicrobiota bacterium]